MKRPRVSFIHCFALALSSAILAFISVPTLQAATPASGTLIDNSTTLSYSGVTTTINPASFDPTTCQTAGSCDVYTLTVNLSNHYRAGHPNFRVNIQFGWTGNTNEFDMYDYFGGNVIDTSVNSFVTSCSIWKTCTSIRP